MRKPIEERLKKRGFSLCQTVILDKEQKQMKIKKYIVKNCPAFEEHCYCHNKGDGFVSFYCDENSNCLIKQIIEKLKDLPFSACSCEGDLLELFDIEEV